MSVLSDEAGSVDWQPTEAASRHTDSDRAISRIRRVTHIDRILSISILFYYRTFTFCRQEESFSDSCGKRPGNRLQCEAITKVAKTQINN